MRSIKLLSSLFLLLLAQGAALAGSAADEIGVSEPYARAVPPGQPNSAAFMVLQNAGGSDHAVVAATCSVSQVAELHTHTMANGMMQMRQIERIVVPAGGETRLQPGGLHVMMIGLQENLQPGGVVTLQLRFEDGSTKTVEAPVRKLQMKMKMMPHKGGVSHGNMQH